MTFTPEAVKPTGPAGPPSKVLERALKLYDAEDFFAASIELKKVLEGQSRRRREEQAARRVLHGQDALQHEVLLGVARATSTRSSRRATNHRYYQKTLQWLASLSRLLPETAGILEKIGKYTTSRLDQPALEPVRDELYYLLGRYYYAKGQTSRRRSRCSAGARQERVLHQGEVLRGRDLRPQVSRASRPSTRSRRSCARSSSTPTSTRPTTSRTSRSSRNLSLARVFYSTQQFDTSIKYFEKLGPMPQDSRRLGRVAVRGVVGVLHEDANSKALGNIHTLNVAVLRERVLSRGAASSRPSSTSSAASTIGSQEAINEFNEIYPDLRKEIDDILAKYPDNAEFYDYILKIKSGEAGLWSARSTPPMARSTTTLLKNIEWVNELDRELKAIDKADPAWKTTAVAGNILQDLTLQQSLAANDAGKLARERLAASRVARFRTS